jgi:hypothetical protein
MEQQQKAGDLTPAQVAEIAKRESQPLIAQAINLTIKNDEQLKGAATMLAQVKSISKNVKAQKDPIVKNLNEALKNVRELFKPTELGLSDAEAAIKKAILDYTQKQIAKAEKKAAKIEAKVDDGEMTLQDGMNKLGKIKQASTNVEVDNGSAQIRTVKKLRITDPALLPPSYFLRESVLEALRKEVAADVLRGGQPCPTGAEVYEEQTVAGRIG